MRTLYAILLLGAVAAAQETGDRISVPFSDPSRPQRVTGSLVNGCFAVEGYDGKEVLVETRGGGEVNAHRRVPRGAEGMRRIDSGGLGINVEEENNSVRIHGMGGHSLVVRVPRTVSLKLECTNGGDLKVSNVAGDLDLNNLNGSIQASNVSGSVLAHSLNGRVTVTLDRVTPDRPMSFSTLNGDIDVTFPAETKATLRMKSDNGEIYTDFEVKLMPNASKPVVEDSRSSGGKYRVKLDKVLAGTINGGGPDITLKTLNGNIFVRQRK